MLARNLDLFPNVICTFNKQEHVYQLCILFYQFCYIVCVVDMLLDFPCELVA
jgi:hypothetical protein